MFIVSNNIVYEVKIENEFASLFQKKYQMCEIDWYDWLKWSIVFDKTSLQKVIFRLDSS